MPPEGATTEGGAHIIVTLDAIYQLVIETRDTVRDMTGSAKELSKDSDDHEKRIRSLERKIWILAGAGMVGASLGQPIWSALGLG